MVFNIGKMIIASAFAVSTGEIQVWLDISHLRTTFPNLKIQKLHAQVGPIQRGHLHLLVTKVTITSIFDEIQK